ncbi:MAG: acyl-CoA dehydrogenase family protein, partial [Anaerolineales bacterium]|nr:acyl-CoA dehydrogenase family protein [Anaerolineales bacterium]
MNFNLTDEQQAFRDVVHKFMAEEMAPTAKETDETAVFNWPVVKKMGPLGLLGMEVPEEYGGAG